MQFVCGNYSHVINEGASTFAQRKLLAFDQLPYATEETWVLRGFMQAANQNALLVVLNALEAAYFFPGSTVRLIGNDGLTVLRQMQGFSRLGGVRVPNGVQYPRDGSTDAEFSTFRNYEITLVGTYPVVGANVPANPLIEWYDHLEYSGGLQVYRHAVPIEGLGQTQQVIENNTFSCRQVGRATTLYGPHPAPAPPVFPDFLDESPNIRYEQPKAVWLPQGRQFFNFTTTWEYIYGSETPLLGYPTLPG